MLRAEMQLLPVRDLLGRVNAGGRLRERVREAARAASESAPPARTVRFITRK